MIPVVEEQVEIRKQRVETGGVRVKTTTRERNEVVDVPFERTDVSVERVKVDRPSTPRPKSDRKATCSSFLSWKKYLWSKRG